MIFEASEGMGANERVEQWQIDAEIIIIYCQRTQAREGTVVALFRF